MPLTFYKSVDDLPPFEDYDMDGRTYRFFDGEPLYAFGHGLSYTAFAYDNLRTSAETLGKDGAMTVSVDVTNTGNRAGDEVVQLYVQHPDSDVARPKRELKGFDRITLAPGETKTVALRLAASDLAYWDASAGRWVVEAKPVRLQVGGRISGWRRSSTCPRNPVRGRCTR